MFGEDYAYAVARIRVLETGLLNQAAIEQLLACQDEQQCLQILTEKGWGNGDPAAGADAILSREREKIWEIMALDAIKKAGERSKEEIVRQYAESTVAVADIRIAVRACKTGKSSDFMKKAMAECDTLDKERLIHAAVSGMDQIMSYLAETKYGDGALALAESASAFERWCDNQIMETIRPQLYNSFSLGPLVAYVLARENEIKTVRIILTGKRSGLPEEFIRERAREMYV